MRLRQTRVRERESVCSRSDVIPPSPHSQDPFGSFSLREWSSTTRAQARTGRPRRASSPKRRHDSDERGERDPRPPETTQDRTGAEPFGMRRHVVTILTMSPTPAYPADAGVWRVNRELRCPAG